jgi:hypothetical protein
MRVIVAPVARETEPGEAGEALAFGQHVGSYARLARSERLNQTIGLDFGDPAG